MMTIKTMNAGIRRLLLGSAVLGAAAVIVPPPSIGSFGSAYAQDQVIPGHGSGQGAGRQGGQSGHGNGAGSTQQGGSGQGGSGQGGGVTRGHYGQGGSTGEGTGDEGTSEDKKGPNYGGGENTRKPAPGTTGGRPVWAKEGIPEVELGRLSVARAPAPVLQHAFSEVTANWVATTGSTVMTLAAEGQPTLTMTVAQLYSLPATEFARIVQTYYDSIVRIDSPLENLSLLKDVRTNNATVLSNVTPASTTDLAAIFLGSASDKTIPITADTVTAINTILQLPPLTPEQTADLAAKAEAVRLAIEAGHG